MRHFWAAAALLALAACGGSGGGGESDPDAVPEMTIDTPEGTVRVGGGASAEANLPEGIPAYPGADRETSVAVQGQGASGAGTMLGLRTQDPPAEVLAFYERAARQARFEITSQMTMGDTAMLTAERDGTSLHITASRTGDGTHIQLIAGRSE